MVGSNSSDFSIFWMQAIRRKKKRKNRRKRARNNTKAKRRKSRNQTLTHKLRLMRKYLKKHRRRAT
jgi:hypothetical protein